MKKINTRLKKNKNISFYKNTNEIDLNSAFIFNSVPLLDSKEDKLWQHFKGIEIETKKNVFDDEIFNLMDFDCDQRDSVHFFLHITLHKK